MPIDTHRINLLPVAVSAKRRGRQSVVVLMIGALAVVVLLGFLWFQKGQQVSTAKAETEKQKAKNAELVTKIAKLDYIEAKSKSVTDREVLVKASWSGELSWYRVLQDVATTMPPQTWLSSFTAASTVTAPKSGAPAAKASAQGGVVLAGTFSVNGKGFDHPDSADWLARISQMKEVANLWLSHSTATGGDNSTQRSVTFDSAGFLTDDAFSPRAKKAVTGNLYDGTNAQ